MDLCAHHYLLIHIALFFVSLSITQTQADFDENKTETSVGSKPLNLGRLLTTTVKMKPLQKRATGSPMATLMDMDMGQTPQSAGQFKQLSSSSQLLSPHTCYTHTWRRGPVEVTRSRSLRRKYCSLYVRSPFSFCCICQVSSQFQKEHI